MEKTDRVAKEEPPRFDIPVTEMPTTPSSSESDKSNDSSGSTKSDSSSLTDKVNEVDDSDAEVGASALFEDVAKTLDGKARPSSKSTDEPDEIDFGDFTDPFAAPEAGEGPKLHTELPGPLPQDPDGKDDKGKKANDKDEKMKDGPQVVFAVQVVPEPPKDVSKAEENGFKRPEPAELSPKVQQRMKNVQEITDFAKKNFDALDDNKDGKLDIKELEKKLLDPKVANGDDAAKLVALYSVASSLPEALEGGEAKGLTKGGLKKLEEISKDKDFFRKAERGVAINELSTVFSHLNTDGSNYDLTPKEVDETLKRKDLSDEQRQALKDVRQYQDHMLTKKYPGLRTDTDGTKWIDRSEGPFVMSSRLENMGDLKSRALNNDFLSSKEYLTTAMSNTLEQSRDRLKNAKANENLISQGADGSCFFIAPLAALQADDPSFMDKLIADNKDGTYTVKFPGKPDEPITVKAPTDAEMAVWAHGKKASILEKAFSDHYVKHLIKHKELDEEQTEQIKSPIQSARILGGHAVDAFKLLTGKDAEKFELEKKSETQIKDLLQENQGKPLTADTRYFSPGLVGPHSYALKYDQKTNEVILENPVKPARAAANKESYPYEPFNIDRKAKDGRDDGVFRMSLTEFQKNFVRITHLK